MRHFVTLALAALLLAPAAVAQSVTAAPALVPVFDAGFAPGDTTVLANRTENDQLTTFSDGNGNYLFGTGSFNTEIFGSGYALPAEGAFDVFGGVLFVTVPPDGGTFDVSVYAGTILDGPTGEPLYTQTFDAGIIPAVSGTTVTATQFEFDEDVEIFGEAFFLVYDVTNVTGSFGAGATGTQTDPTPETIIFRNGAFVRVDETFTSGGSPLQTYLFGDALVVEVEAREAPASSFAEARTAGVGADVTVEGTVSRAQGDFVYFQDETGGLTLRQTDEEGQFFMDVASGAIAPGTVLRVSGTLSAFNGLLQINNDDLASYEIVGQGDAPAAQTVTLAEIAANGEDYEGELVTVAGVTIDGSADADGNFDERANYDIDDGSMPASPVVLRVPNEEDTEIAGQEIPSGSVAITGVVGQFSSADPAAGYQILVIRDGDVGGSVAIGEDPEGRLALGAMLPNPSAASAAVTVSLAAPGRATLAVYDVLGRQVAVVLDEDLAAGDRAVRVDVSALPAGTYLARLTANGALVVRPFTVVR